VEWPSRKPVEELHMVQRVLRDPVGVVSTVLSSLVMPVASVILLSLLSVFLVFAAFSHLVPAAWAARVARGPATPPRR